MNIYGFDFGGTNLLTCLIRLYRGKHNTEES